ncbi:MAG: Crp/Fnr family transcriptional regulator [Patescibacteria group bacterium]|nr:Crp/Fnr family transcriptional regulator [Patescibacteria group bacterium]
MNDQEKVKKLKAFGIFNELSEKELLSVSKFIHHKILPPKTIFISQDSKPDVIYLLYKGLARAFRDTDEGKDISLSVIGQGEIIGEMGVIEDLPRSASVETIKETEVFLLTKENFINLLKTHPKASINLLKSLSKRLRNLTERVEGVVAKSMEDRTLEALQILSKFFLKKEILLSHEELATIVGATRARVTEVLDNLKNKGKIELHHRKIKLL